MRVVLIVGTGRCGSSALAGALHALGVNFCDHLVPGHPTLNAKGHFECFHWRDVGRRIQENGQQATADDLDRYVALAETHARPPVWAIKDPYLCWALAPVVKVLGDAGHDVNVIAIHRQFVSSVRSRMEHEPARRHRAETMQLERLQAMTDHLLRVKRPVLHVNYEHLIERPAETIADVRRFLYAGLDDGPTMEQIEAAERFIDPALQHYV